MRGGCGIALLALGLAASSASAQEQPTYYVVHQEFAKPSMVKDYEATTKEFVAMVKKNKAAMPHFSFVALQSEDFVYTFVARIPNYGGIDGINQDFGALAQKEGGAFADLMKRGGSPTEFVRESVVSLAAELSYTPAAPRLKPEEVKYLHYDIYHVMPGREEDADAVCKEFLALFKSKNIANGYRIFKSATGPEMPAIIVETGAKDPADFYTQQVADRAALGAAGEALFARGFSITRRFERRDGWLRPDLSVPPAAPAQK